MKTKFIILNLTAGGWYDGSDYRSETPPDCFIPEAEFAVQLDTYPEAESKIKELLGVADGIYQIDKVFIKE